MDTKKKNKFMKAAKASDKMGKDDKEAKMDDKKKSRSGKEVRKAMYGKEE